jgi:hypothetical protein
MKLDGDSDILINIIITLIEITWIVNIDSKPIRGGF